jgi:hypothetical protein
VGGYLGDSYFEEEEKDEMREIISPIERRVINECRFDHLLPWKASP